MRSLVVLLFFIPHVSWALTCDSIYSNSNKSVANTKKDLTSAPAVKIVDFWSRQQVSVTFPTGKKNLTYSLDSEVTPADAYRYISTDPQALSALKDSLPNQTYHIQEILRLTGLSEGQFKFFGLRKGIPKDQQVFHVTELAPEVFGTVLSKKMDYPAALLSNSLNIITSKKNIPLKAGIDDQDVEFRHTSYETSPLQFKLVIEDLHKKAKTPMTHIHVGLPGEISRAKTAEITRSVEAEAILTLAEDAALGQDNLPYYEFTTLNETQPSLSHQRGVVRLGYHEWTQPHLSHNLEIRQYGNLKHGLALVEKVSYLAQNHDRLIVTETALERIPDTVTANLPGALFHVGSVLKRSQDAGDQSVAHQLLKFSSEILSHGEITLEKRLEIANFLIKTKPLQRLKVDYYLKADGKAPR